MLTNYILSAFLLFTIFSFSQEEEGVKVHKDVYGLRVGVDLANPIRTLFNEDRKSVELVADYRITKNIYGAVELGFLDKNSQEDNIDYTTNGQYVKIGANYNMYDNWLDMENETYIGLRYGFSNFKQTLNSYLIYSDTALPLQENTTPTEFSDLFANWFELVFGLKVEVFDNVFLGASASLKKVLSTSELDNFKSLEIPGFDRVYLNGGGFGFNYTITYRLPLYKKDKVNLEEKEVEEIKLEE